MATLHTVITALEEEIVQKISQISPDTNPDVLFDNLPEWEGDTPTGKIRSFFIEWDMPQQFTTGSSVKKYTLNGSIVVGYPIEHWQIARATDTDKIKRALGLNAGQSSISGVSYRLIDNEAQPEAEIQDDWIWVRYPLLTVVESTE